MKADLQNKNTNSPSAKVGSKVSQGVTPSPVAQLHRKIGNRAAGLVLQTKLKINKPDDEYEREADSIAQHVMSMSSSDTIQRKCSCGGNSKVGQCASCRKKRVQLKARNESITAISDVPQSVQDSISSPGRPLESSTRSSMESGFGVDFSDVRVHTDSKAAQSAHDINANAYTVGPDIVFAGGQYSPHSPAGKYLLAHELTHVIQQSFSGPALNRQADAPEEEGIIPDEIKAFLPADLLQFPSNLMGPDLIKTMKGLIPPEWLNNLAADFCVPFDITDWRVKLKVWVLRQFLLTAFIQAERAVFGDDVAQLWKAYLQGKKTDILQWEDLSAKPGMVEAFQKSETTIARQEQLIRLIKRKLPKKRPVLPENVWTPIPISEFLADSDLKSSGHDGKTPADLNFNDPFSIPGNTAGGVGKSAKGDDTRKVSGNVLFFRRTDRTGKTLGVSMKTDFDFEVKDALDFCPLGSGDIGADMESFLTVPLSRLEATEKTYRTSMGLAWDKPFLICYKGPTVEQELEADLVERSWGDTSKGGGAFLPVLLGALAGAAGGALIGGLIGGGVGALIGAGIGGVVGGLAGLFIGSAPGNLGAVGKGIGDFFKRLGKRFFNFSKVYMVIDKRAFIRTAPPKLEPNGQKIPFDSQIEIVKRHEKDGLSYVYVKKAYGNKSDWGWTLESNLDETDYPTEDRLGTKDLSGVVIKHGSYLQPDTVQAIKKIDNPIEIKNDQGEVTERSYLRITEGMYPSCFGHKSKGHYTGHCVDIAFADDQGKWKAYSGQAKTKIENQEDKAFTGSTFKHSDHFHGCASYPAWVNSRTTPRLKKLLKERINEFNPSYTVSATC